MSVIYFFSVRFGLPSARAGRQWAETVWVLIAFPQYDLINAINDCARLPSVQGSLPVGRFESRAVFKYAVYPRRLTERVRLYKV